MTFGRPWADIIGTVMGFIELTKPLSWFFHVSTDKSFTDISTDKNSQ